MKKVNDLSNLEVKTQSFEEMMKEAIDYNNNQEEIYEQKLVTIEENSKNLSGYQLYIASDPRDTAMNMPLYTELYEFCILAIRKRLVMVLGLEEIISKLLNIESYTYGFSQNPTTFQMKDLVNIKKDINKILKTKQIYNYLEFEVPTKDETSSKKTYKFIWRKQLQILRDIYNDDYEIFGADETTRYDYISTYQTLLRMLTKIPAGEDLEFIRDVIHNPNDELEDEIIKNSLEPDTTSYIENEDYEDSDYEYEYIYN
jgi:hypothetical protein